MIVCSTGDVSLRSPRRLMQNPSVSPRFPEIHFFHC